MGFPLNLLCPLLSRMGVERKIFVGLVRLRRSRGRIGSCHAIDPSKLGSVVGRQMRQHLAGFFHKREYTRAYTES